MQSNIIKRSIGPVLFIIFNIVIVTWLLSSFPRVLILHSYEPNYLWTKSINNHLDIGLRERQYIKYQYYYMDSKQYYNEQIEKTSLRAIKNYAPDLIIAFDDNAQKLLSKHISELPEDTKIIFSGVNGYVDKYDYNGKDNITGIFERKPVNGVIFALSQFNQSNNTPDHKALTLLTDSSTSSLIDIEILQQADWQDFNFSADSVSTFAQWQQYIRQIDPERVNYLLVAGYRKLIDQTVATADRKIYVDHQTVADWTQENSPVPVIALNAFGAQDGFAFAIGSSAAEQANEPLLMMDDILRRKTKPSDIPYRYGQYYTVAINDRASKNFNYSIPVYFYSFAASANSIYR